MSNDKPCTNLYAQRDKFLAKNCKPISIVNTIVKTATTFMSDNLRSVYGISEVVGNIFSTIRNGGNVALQTVGAGSLLLSDTFPKCLSALGNSILLLTSACEIYTSDPYVQKYMNENNHAQHAIYNFMNNYGSKVGYSILTTAKYISYKNNHMNIAYDIYDYAIANKKDIPQEIINNFESFVAQIDSFCKRHTNNKQNETNVKGLAPYTLSSSPHQIIKADPQAILEFANKLNQFNKQLQYNSINLDAQLKSLGNHWKDQNYRELTINHKQRRKYIDMVLAQFSDEVTYLRAKAKALEASKY